MRTAATAIIALSFATGPLLTGLLGGAEPQQKPQQKSPQAPRPLAEAAGHFSLPEGFRATLCAGEPDVVQPIAFTIDGRGRLWVVESHTYPSWIEPDAEGKDRVLIFEDADGDGRFDSRKVFWDKGPNLSGIEVGFGGVWLCATPNLLFVPDRDGDDRPDAKPDVLLDGWNLEEAGHNVFNGLTWGPDGWLYGLNGIQSKSAVGDPEGPDDQRAKFDCGVWRYHPTRHAFEVVAWGTTNPFGLDFDDHGRMFITNCVIEHLWHVVPGAHFKRMYGEDYNPHIYGQMQSCADHLHFIGDWTDARKEGETKNFDAGGGHAHVGAMVYLGDNWPDEYRGNLFTVNLHGTRLNREVFEPRGSGVVARHGKDFMQANDPWFRGLELAYGPDGGVYLTDWSDTGECHDAKEEEVERGNGRIFKITYGDPKPVKVDVAALSDAELVKLQLNKNDWFVRQARRVLQERAAAGKLGPAVAPALNQILAENGDVTRKLRALWALHVTGTLGDARRLDLLGHADELVRAWVIQLETEGRQPPDAVLSKLAEMAKSDPSPTVRLYLASALQRLPLEKRWAIAEGLIGHAEDVSDQNLPLMYWYGIEPLVAADRTRALGLLGKSKVPLIREHITRRVAAAKK